MSQSKMGQDLFATHPENGESVVTRCRLFSCAFTKGSKTRWMRSHEFLFVKTKNKMLAAAVSSAPQKSDKIGENTPALSSFQTVVVEGN